MDSDSIVVQIADIVDSFGTVGKRQEDEGGWIVPTSGKIDAQFTFSMTQLTVDRLAWSQLRHTAWHYFRESCNGI